MLTSFSLKSRHVELANHVLPRDDPSLKFDDSKTESHLHDRHSLLISTLEHLSRQS